MIKKMNQPMKMLEAQTPSYHGKILNNNQDGNGAMKIGQLGDRDGIIDSNEHKMYEMLSQISKWTNIASRMTQDILLYI